MVHPSDASPTLVLQKQNTKATKKFAKYSPSIFLINYYARFVKKFHNRNEGSIIQRLVNRMQMKSTIRNDDSLNSVRSIKKKKKKEKEKKEISNYNFTNV